ncbi:adenylate/guanylate cyclase domain-containing protein [Paracoccus sp. M683]|uniref:adenylate/guanylate cyclase domain-containing protein n=1 Tax=Paracoccus sp. M683 TaxID=2594268 RepID=UPI00117F2163|nr:adenylate/guanylate cyclase domain-containing protein [Paracoccus sp. M683]TRW94302.1 adenylate/guanylate cyclase domain-containing protein [Paracoccus sp. M683]
MSLHDDLTSAVDNVLGKKFSQRDGQNVPSSEDVTLANGAVKIEAAFLYADLAGSGRIAKSCPWDTTAKIIRAYLDCAVRIIRAHNGAIRSFDGDRVMGVFVGDYKRTNATKSALKIQWATRHLIQEEARKRFKSVKDNDVKIQQACGVDVGMSRAVRAGIRNNNDLIWIGSPPSFAAKLSDLREYPYCTYISAGVYNRIADEAKLSKGVDMWEKRSTNFAGASEVCYRSSYWWKP